MKRLTVITVTFNAETTLEQTIRSVVNQTAFDQIEYILVDGFSTDRTLQIAKLYRNQFARIICEPDQGIYDAMNKGARLATTPWICFMNAGDTFFNDQVIEKLNLPEEAQEIIYGNAMIKAGKGMWEQKPNPFWTQKDKCNGIGICHQALFTPTSWLLEHPFEFTQYQYCCDYEFCWWCWKRGRTFRHINLPICFFEWGAGFSSKPSAARKVLNENARIAHCRWGYWHLRHIWRQWRANRHSQTKCV